MQEPVQQRIQHEDGHVDIRVRPEVPPGNPGLYYRTQVFGRKKVHLLQKLGPKREFFLENHLEVDSINPGVALDKADSRQRALFYSFEKIRTGGLSFYLSQRLPDKIHRIVENDMEKTFLTSEVLKKRALGYADPLHHAIHARLPEPVARELVCGRIENFALLGFVKFVESRARQHGILASENK